MKMRIISLCLVVTLLFAMLPQIALTASATEVLESGTCGEQIQWTLDDTGTLTLSGQGAMADYGSFTKTWDGNYTYSLLNQPWSKERDNIRKIVIEEGITYIGDTAFASCESLTSVELPNSLLQIGDAAFASCTLLEELTLPNGVIAIERLALSRSGLKIIFVPDSLETIADNAFSYCNSITEVNYSGSQADWENIEFGDNNWPLINANIIWGKEGQTDISVLASGDCGDHTSWILTSDGVLTISGSGRMAGWGSYTQVPWYDFAQQIFTVNINSGVTSIGDLAFARCEYLTNVKLPDTMTRINLGAFAGCRRLTEIVVPEGVKRIGDKTFADCFALTSVTMPVSVTYISFDAFQNCDSLMDVYYGGSKSEWNGITMYSGNECLTAANIHYNAEYGDTYEFSYETCEEQEKEVLAGSEETSGSTTSIGFCLDKDGWCFANAAQSFAAEPVSHADKYFIPRERYDDIFGKSYVDATEGLYTEKWGGNCAGMSATAILFFLDNLDWDNIDTRYSEDFTNPNDFYRTVNLHHKSQSYYPAIGNDTEVTQLIEAYQLYINAINKTSLVENLEGTYFSAAPETKILYGVTEDNEPICTVDYVYNHIPANDGGTYITLMLKAFQEAYEENNPLLIALQADGFGHGIVSRTDLEPEDMGDGWWRIYVYDPNKPYINESVASVVSGVEAEPKYAFGCNTLVDNGGDIYLELNPSLNQWRYCTSVNSNSIDSYIGSTPSGELMWNGVYSNNDNEEEKYHISRPDYFYTIDLTDLTMVDFANPNFDSTTAWIPENDLTIAVDGKTDCSIYTSTGELVAIVEDGDAFVLIDAGSYDAYIGQTEDGSSLGGRIYLPTDTYTVYYSSGAVQFLGSSNAISFSSEGVADLTVDIALNSLQILAQEGGVAAVKCANVTSTDECSYVETEGTLVAGETFTIAYSDENKVEVTTDSKDGKFQLYQKAVDQDEAVVTKVVKSSSLRWIWIVSGVAVVGVVIFVLMKKKKPDTDV